MHIPDAYLSPATQAVSYAVMTPVWVVAARKTRQTLTARQAPLLSISAAFCFAVMMFNIPALGGTTAHALGAVLAAILIGPYAAILAMTLTLVIQALFFGDGGILTLGANSFNMAFVAVAVGYSAYKLVRGKAEPGSTRGIIAGACAAYLGTVAASLSAGFVLGLQPLIAHDAVGHALYFPFGWRITIPAMLTIHLLIAAPAEAVITASALVYCARNFPQAIGRPVNHKTGFWNPRRALIAVLCLTPLGLLASGEAWGEWNPEALQKMVGYSPSGIAKAHDLIKAPLADYGFAGPDGTGWAIAGYVVSAFLGAGLVALFLRVILAKRKPVANPTKAKPTVGSELPGWMLNPNPPNKPNGKSGQWLEKALGSAREAVAETIVRERWANADGFLQKLPALAKTLAFIGLLVTISLIKTPLSLAALLLGGCILARGSKLPVASILARIGGTAAFFGLLPAAILACTLPKTGLVMGEMLILRLLTSILFATLWTTTTHSRDLMASLRTLRLPRFAIRAVMLTIRYIFILIDTLTEMLIARRSRQIGALDKKQARIYAGAGAAVLFGKSIALTDELHMAMRARGCEVAENHHSGEANWKPFWEAERAV